MRIICVDIDSFVKYIYSVALKVKKMAPGTGGDDDELHDFRMAFSLEKILTVSAEAWCLSTNASLANYDLVGVHFDVMMENHLITPTKGSNDKWLLKKFATLVPRHAERIVSYTSCASVGTYRTYYSASGTAVIPKTLLKKTMEGEIENG